MKKLIFVFTIAFAFFACGAEEESKPVTAENKDAKTVVPGPDSPEAMGKTISELVIANNYQGLANLIITKDEMTKVISGSNAPANGKEFAISRIEEEIKVMQVDTKTGLDAIRSEGSAAGIVWESCVFKEAIPTIDKSRGFEMLSLKCILTCNGQEHFITITDVVGTDDGWKLGGKLFFGAPKPIGIQPGAKPHR